MTSHDAHGGSSGGGSGGGSSGRAPNPPVPPIHLSRRVHAPRLTAWAAITDPQQVARWLGRASPIGAVGDAYRLDLDDGRVVTGRVLALDAGRRLACGWGWDGEAAGTTRVTWAIEPMSTGGSRVVLEHDGWSDAGLGRADRDEQEAAWTGHLDALRRLLDGDRPEPPDEVA